MLYILSYLYVSNFLLILRNQFSGYQFSKKSCIYVCINLCINNIINYVLANAASSNYLIHRGTTITDVYAIYKETCLDLQAKTQELEESKRNFMLLEEVILITIF